MREVRRDRGAGSKRPRVLVEQDARVEPLERNVTRGEMSPQRWVRGLRRNDRVAEGENLAVLLGKGRRHALACIMHEFVISIDEHEDVACGRSHSRIARGPRACILLGQKPNARVHLGNRGDNVGRAVSRAIIDAYDFDIGERLTQQRAQAGLDVISLVVDGNDDRNSWHDNYLERLSLTALMRA